MSYLSILENASISDALSDEGREILSMAIDDTKEFLHDREHETSNAVYQDQLNLLQVICDNHIALHSVEMLIQVRRGLITI
jgi:hypothetical protein